MYMVISRWQAMPGKEEEFENTGRKMRRLLLEQPGVRLVESFRNDAGDYYVMHGYDDEGSYNRIVNDENSAFGKAMAENDVDGIGKWISSERGETVD